MIARQIGRNGPSAAPITTRVASSVSKLHARPDSTEQTENSTSAPIRNGLRRPIAVRPAADQEGAERPGQRQARIGPAELLVAELEVRLHERREEGQRHAVEIGEAERQPEQHHARAARSRDAAAVPVHRCRRHPAPRARLFCRLTSRFASPRASRRQRQRQCAAAQDSVIVRWRSVLPDCDTGRVSARELRAAPFVATPTSAIARRGRGSGSQPALRDPGHFLDLPSAARCAGKNGFIAGPVNGPATGG